MTSDGNWWRANEIVVIRHHSRESETRQSFRVNSPSSIRSRWARNIGSSLIAVQAVRARETEKVGLSARPALTAKRASIQSTKPREGYGQIRGKLSENFGWRRLPVEATRPPAPNCRVGS